MGNARARGTYDERKANPTRQTTAASPLNVRYLMDRMTDDQQRAVLGRGRAARRLAQIAALKERA
jgi:hypothetical protein